MPSKVFFLNTDIFQAYNLIMIAFWSALIYGLAFYSFSVEPRMESMSPISEPSDSTSAPPLSSPPPCMSEPCPASASESAPSTLPPASSASPLASTSPPPGSLPLPPPSSVPSEPQHDVSYFRWDLLPLFCVCVFLSVWYVLNMCLYVFYRAVIASETERLTGLSEFWELRFDDSSIPEESESAVWKNFFFF